MNRPVVAIISNVQTPYRVAMHRRLIQAIPEVMFYSVYTHDVPDQNWGMEHAADTNPVAFGRNDRAEDQKTYKAQPREFIKSFAMIRWLKEHNVRAIAIGGYNDLGRVRIILHAKARGIPLFLFSDSNIHSDHLRGWKRWAKKMLVRPLIHACDLILIAGENGRKYYQSYGVPLDRMIHNPLEVDYDLIASITQEQVNSAAQRFALSPSRKRLVFCARLHPLKSPDLLIDAFIAMANHAPDWDLVMIGDGEMRDQLHQRVPAEFKSRIQWLGFVPSPEDIFSVYRNCHALVLPSEREPWGLVINEAAASGLPIVSSAGVGAVPELVHEGVNGITFPTGDLQGLISALRTITTADTAERLGARSKEVLEAMRAKADPVKAMREALRRSGVLSERGVHVFPPARHPDPPDFPK